ncbi:hypothetical protein EMWEY_00048680 [Eimeria maxima]|uniref:Uncharacterized protein n=1 Tax=Eimeria maxima TaxID=5804 RepID=U6M566_EIMMA|nr:hypothetical protein EMWEY_00048680 [Eimeria maxima]CDJ58208.1 hypothetical protein EMWEY_00048680 [Eimeria maxima]
MTKTLKTFQLEWFEAQLNRGSNPTTSSNSNNSSNSSSSSSSSSSKTKNKKEKEAPEVFRTNEALRHEIDSLKHSLEEAKETAEQKSAAFDLFKKEKDVYRLQSRRLYREKEELLGTLKQLKSEKEELEEINKKLENKCQEKAMR